MTTENFLESNKKIVEEVGLDPHSICELIDLDNQSEFLNFFEFYSETLRINQDYGIHPSYLYFHNSDSLNARAGRSVDGHYVIGVNRGTVNWLINKFKLNNSLIADSKVLLFDTLKPYFDTSLNNLMFQSGCHFTFYHEMAHLIQKSEYLELNIEESPKLLDVFDINRHLIEIDADSFSALFMGTHIIQYTEKLVGTAISRTLVEALIVLFSVPIILYLLSFSGNRLSLYYKEGTHPHPAIRLTNFLLVLTHYCNGIFKKKDLGFTASQGDVILNAMAISEILQEQFFDHRTVSIYRENLTNNRPEVIEYLSELVELNNVSKTTATAKWNKNHTKHK